MTIDVVGTLTDGRAAHVLHAGNSLSPKSLIVVGEEDSDRPASSVLLGDTADRWRPRVASNDRPRDLTNAAWTTTNATVVQSAGRSYVSPDATNAEHSVAQTDVDLDSTEEQILGVRVRRAGAMGDIGGVQLLADDGSSTFSATFLLTDLTIPASSGATGKIVSRGDGEYLLTIRFTPSATTTTGDIKLLLTDDTGATTFIGDANDAIEVVELATHRSLSSVRMEYFTEEDFDCFGVAAHNLGSTGARIRLDQWNGSSWVNVSEIEPTDDSPIMVFADQFSSDELRIQIDRGFIPEIGVVRAGEALVFQRTFYGGFTIARNNRRTEVIGNISSTGELLGRSRKRTTLSATYSWENLTYDWVRDNLEGPDKLIQAVEVDTAFLAWRPGVTEDADYIMRAGTQAPQAMGTKNLWTFQMTGEVHSYE